jgi:hypothetical protein
MEEEAARKAIIIEQLEAEKRRIEADVESLKVVNHITTASDAQRMPTNDVVLLA